MKALMRKLLSAILVIAIIATGSLTGLAEAVNNAQTSSGNGYTLAQEITWAEVGKQLAGMLGFIVEDAANTDLAAYSDRIANLSLEDDSIYLAILAENGYLPEEPAQIDPAATITAEEYMQLMQIAFPTTVDSQEAIDALAGTEELGNVAVIGDDLSVNAVQPKRIAVTAAQNLSLIGVEAEALTLNAASSVDLNKSEIARVHIKDTAVEEEVQSDEEAEAEPDLIYLHMDADTTLPEIIVKSADEVIIEGSGALGVIRVQEAVGSLTVRATASVINETEVAFEVTGPDAQVVELQPGEQVDFVLTKWLVSFVTEGTAVETQEIAPGGMVDFDEATTTLEGKVFTAWYEDADYTTPTSRLATVDRQMTLYARFVDEADAAVVTFETFGGLELEPLTFAKGEYLLTKPVQKLYTYKEGYSFGGWCVDEECTTGFGYTDPIEESMTLYAYFASNEEVKEEKHDSTASIELPDGNTAIGLVLPEGMSADEALENLSVEAGTGGEAPEIAVRETENGAEIYCEAGFTPGFSFTLTAQNGVQFAGLPEYVDTLTVSIFREESRIVEFAEGLTYVLWDDVTDYTPVTKTESTSETTSAPEITINNMLGDYDSQSTIVPGSLVMTGDTHLYPGQIVVFYDGDLGWDEGNVMFWEGGDLAGYVLYAQIETVEERADGARDVTFRYANPEDYIANLDIHTSEEVNMEEELTDAQLAQVEKNIATQLASNEELQAQMLVTVMTSSETQEILDDMYGEGTYSLAKAKAYLTDIDADPVLTPDGNTVTASVDVSFTIKIISEQGVLAILKPRLFFEEQLTLGLNADGGFLWLDASIEFRTKTTVRLELSATTGGELDAIDKARNTLEEIVTASGEAIEGYDYQRAARSLMYTMNDLIEADLEYQDLFAVQLLNIKKRISYGLVTVGGKLELMGQAACIATFGVTVTAEFGTKVGFHFNFKKMKGNDYKEDLGSDVTSQIDLIGKLGVRMGLAVSLYYGLTVVAMDYLTGSFYAYVELAGMFLHKAALSAGGGNYAGALYMEVGVDFDFELTAVIDVLLFSYELNVPLWSYRWNLYSLTRGMTMSIVQKDKLDAMWELAMRDVNGRTCYIFSYLPMESYDMLTAKRTDNQLLFETLQSGNVTAKFTLENVVINGEPVSANDPRVNVIYAGDGVKGKAGVIYADEMAAAAHKVTLYDCDVVLTYENKNGSELIKHHRQVFHLTREFKMATITVNVNFALYDWCAHAWGLEAAEWDGKSLYKYTFENTHVLGCPVEPTATRGVSLDTFVSAAKSRYPELENMTLSWFNPTRNDVNLTTQLSVPGFSDTCYITPNSSTLRYSLYSTSMEYDLNFYLYVKRFPGYTGEITYIIEAPDAKDDTVFTVRGADGGRLMTFTRMAGSNPKRWSLTVPRSAFDGTKRTIMMGTSRGDSTPTNLTVNGREKEDVVTLHLSNATRSVEIILGEGVIRWDTSSHDISKMDAITPGDQVTISVDLAEGYTGVRAITDPEGVKYSYTPITSQTGEFTFTMPYSDLKLTLYGTKSYKVDFMYNCDGHDLFSSVDVERDTAVNKPSTPFVDGLVFAGWYDNADCTGEPFDFTQPVTQDTTLYAAWKVMVTVDLGNAKGQAAYITGRRYVDVEIEDGVYKTLELTDTELIFPGDDSGYDRYTYATQMLGENALEYALPNYPGYEFVGWYTNPDCTGEAVKPQEYVLTGSVTFYARWRKIAIITYEINNGEENAEPYDMYLEYAGEKLTHIPADPEREHYIFTGWYSTAATQSYQRVNLTSFIPEDSMSLYAGWRSEQYTITYELGGGTNNPSNPTSYNYDSGEIVIGNPTRKGYRFLGWTATGIEAVDGKVTIPVGYKSDITLTANWELLTFTLEVDPGRGTLPESVPATYTVEDADIAIGNPTRAGHLFLGWTGTGLTDPVVDLVIPTGSVGNRSYTANWKTIETASDVLQAALNAVSNPFVMNVRDYSDVADFQAAAMAKVAADEACAPFVDQLSLAAELTGGATEDETAYSYPAKVTVTFTADDGSVISRSKSVTLRVEKNPVTIDVAPEYTVGGKYIEYNTSLKDVKLTGTATSDGKTVQGSFAWADGAIVPVSADNGKAIYKVVFTPNDTKAYSGAEALIAVNTQTAVQLGLSLPATIEYTGEALEVSDCDFYAMNVETGERLDAAVTFTGAVLDQYAIVPGWSSVALTSYESLTISGVTGNDLYKLLDTYPEADFSITRAKPVISGKLEYSAEYDQLLYDVALDLQAKTAAGKAIDGSFAWVNPATRLDAGEQTCQVRFTPADLSCYRSVTIDVKVIVSGEPGQITYNLTVNGLNDTDTPDELAFSVKADNGAVKTLNFKLVDGSQNQWSLTADRAAFADDTVHPILLQRGEGKTVECGQNLTITGRETEDVVELTMEYLPRTLTVTAGEGVKTGIWVGDIKNNPYNVDAIRPGDEVFIYAEPADGYNNVKVTKASPTGLDYSFTNDFPTFIMPNEDVEIELTGVTTHRVTFHYGNDQGVYCYIDVENGQTIGDQKPADPTLDGMTFLGWYQTKGVEIVPDPFDFENTPVHYNMDLDASWMARVTVDFCGPKGAALYMDTSSPDEAIPRYLIESGQYPGQRTKEKRDLLL